MVIKVVHLCPGVATLRVIHGVGDSNALYISKVSHFGMVCSWYMLGPKKKKLLIRTWDFGNIAMW